MMEKLQRSIDDIGSITHESHILCISATLFKFEEKLHIRNGSQNMVSFSREELKALMPVMREYIKTGMI